MATVSASSKEELRERCIERILITTTAKANYQEEDAIIISGNSCTSLGALARRLDARPRYARPLYAFPRFPSLPELWHGPGRCSCRSCAVSLEPHLPRGPRSVSQPVPCRTRRAGGALRPGCAGARGGAARAALPPPPPPLPPPPPPPRMRRIAGRLSPAAGSRRPTAPMDGSGGSSGRA